MMNAISNFLSGKNSSKNTSNTLKNTSNSALKNASKNTSSNALNSALKNASKNASNSTPATSNQTTILRNNSIKGGMSRVHFNIPEQPSTKIMDWATTAGLPKPSMAGGRRKKRKSVRHRHTRKRSTRKYKVRSKI